VWPKVVEQVPDAELHVYYGMGNIDTLAPNYPYLAEFRQRLANLLLGSVNVVQHGRVAPDVLAADLQKASVWLYPSHNFDETYCISAVEAQLAGAIPVTSNRGALAETVGSGLVIDGTIGIDDGVAEQYAQAVVQLLTGDEKELTALRRKVRRNAPAQGWTEVAAQWLMKIMSPTET
jgi:glycosyltransferase involved in cell wall biosynthesis